MANEPTDDESVGLKVADAGLRAMSAVGTVVFAVCFTVALFSPGSLETRVFNKGRVTQAILDAVGSLASST